MPGALPSSGAHGMKPFIGFEIGAGEDVSAVHGGEAVDEAVAGRVGRVVPTTRRRVCARRDRALKVGWVMCRIAVVCVSLFSGVR